MQVDDETRRDEGTGDEITGDDMIRERDDPGTKWPRQNDRGQNERETIIGKQNEQPHAA
jgi:hypothetical protein